MSDPKPKPKSFSLDMEGSANQLVALFLMLLIFPGGLMLYLHKRVFPSAFQSPVSEPTKKPAP